MFRKSQRLDRRHTARVRRLSASRRSQIRFVDHGHHAGFDLATFRAVGGYDETFSHNEDAEYDERVIQQGGKIFLDATIRKAYHPRGTISSLARQYFNYGKGRARNAFKHKRAP